MSKRLLYLFLFIFISYDSLYFGQIENTAQSDAERLINQKIRKVYEAGAPSVTGEKKMLQLKKECENIDFEKGLLGTEQYLANLYLEQNRYEDLIVLANEVKKRLKGQKDINGTITSIINKSALALGYLGFKEASLKDFHKAIDYSKTIKDQDIKNYYQSILFENMTVRYNINDVYSSAHRDSILYYLNKSRTCALSIIDHNKTVSNELKYDQIAFINIRLGIFYLEGSDRPGYLHKAEQYLLTALSLHENKAYHCNPYNKVMLLNQLSWLYLEKKDYKRSIDFAENALRLEREYPDPAHRVESFEFLSSSYIGMGDKNKSELYLRKYGNLKDSLNVIEKMKSNKSLSIISKKLKDEYKEESKQQWITLSIIILLVCVGVWAMWIKRNKITRKKYELIITRLNNAQSTNIGSKMAAPGKRITVSDEIEEKLLNRIEEFEKSTQYTRKDLTIGLLSGEFNTNPTYLSHIIKKKYDLNFNGYINKLRIEYIISKLYNEQKYSDYKISYLAEECGFASAQVFTIAFKKVSGITPSYFIEQLNSEKK